MSTSRLDTRLKLVMAPLGRLAVLRSGGRDYVTAMPTHARVGFVADDTVSGTYDDRSNELGGTGLTVRTIVRSVRTWVF